MTVSPCSDGCRASRTLEVGGVRPSNSNTNVVQLYVFKVQTSSSGRLRVVRPGSDDANRRVADLAVEEGDRSNIDSRWASSRDVEANFAVVDLDAGICPAPVPKLIDGCNNIGESQVPCSELLVANIEAIVATFEHKISHEASGSLFYEQPLVLGAVARIHLEDDVLQTCRLRRRPVHTSCRHICWDVGHVQDKVADLTEKRVGWSEASSSGTGASTQVGAAINQTETGEIRSGQQSGKTIRIANDLQRLVIYCAKHRQERHT